ncbi:gamma-glutamylcyclotransferase [Salirhabdus salicampi]|uniref:gamma-glutamylcyclotransferase n=1 Tax=Salirhabdus salicampi TaxID=476102 RepID=UPI0020C3451E|nr:gamma-glutamylcyclotransferase family protein [Salirhabdus salicampi]MCP8616240.1 gamma-glutamylcyclotransferase [Salirhabdus salicampi]
MNNKNHKVFVYGTLRKHEKNERLLDNATCIAHQAWTYGRLYDTGNGYPAMVIDASKLTYGELYDVNDEQLQKVDELEGFREGASQNHYEREFVTIYTDNGAVNAYVYTYDVTKIRNLEEVQFGDWKCHQHLNKDSFLYFAYGSCMDDERFQLANVDHHFSSMLGCGVVDGYLLSFTKHSHDGARADIVETNGHKVEGKVYEIGKEALSYLFKREGVYAGAYRPAFIDVIINEKKYHDVLTFLVIEKQPEIAPPINYATEILRGAKGIVSDEYYNKVQQELYDKFNLIIHV